MNRAEGPPEECPGDPTHKRHKQKPKGPQGGGDGTTGSGRVCVSMHNSVNLCVRERESACLCACICFPMHIGV